MNALIIVDIQNDFMPGGPLGVNEGDKVIPVINRMMSQADIVVATKDWHPADHGSFASNHKGKQPGEIIDLNGLEQILWPNHCVQGTNGAEFVDALDTTKVDMIFEKGTDPGIDSYSGFFDNGHKRDTGLNDYLKKQGVDEVYVVGLATDYCVKFTALDAEECEYDTYVVQDAVRAVNLKQGDGDRAIQEMKEKGVKFVSEHEVVSKV